jgi:hypothetical protein
MNIAYPTLCGDIALILPTGDDPTADECHDYQDKNAQQGEALRPGR